MPAELIRNYVMHTTFSSGLGLRTVRILTDTWRRMMVTAPVPSSDLTEVRWYGVWYGLQLSRPYKDGRCTACTACTAARPCWKSKGLAALIPVMSRDCFLAISFSLVTVRFGRMPGHHECRAGSGTDSHCPHFPRYAYIYCTHCCCHLSCLLRCATLR